MDQHRFMMPSLKHSTAHFEKDLSRRLSSCSLLGVSTTDRNTMESRLMLEFLEAEAALAEFRTAQAKELALRTSLSHPRGSLRSSLSPRIAQQAIMHHPTSHHLVESNGILVSSDNVAISSVARTEKDSWQSPAPQDFPYLHSLLRCTNEAVDHQRTLYHPVVNKDLIDSPFFKTTQPHPPPVIPPRRRRKKPKQCWDVSVSFPSKLFKVLEEAETEGHSDVVSFQPGGKSFMIHDQEKFAREVLAKYFRTKRLSSFQKQLSLYGFKRIRKGPDIGVICHEFFQRDNKKLVAKIIRKKQGVPVDT